MSPNPYQPRRAPSGRFLPPDPRVREPHRLTPQLALRVGILGVVALVAFTVLFLRLWSLQVLSGDEHLSAAQDNQLRLVRIEAPRGPILDRRGRVVVSNVAGTAVQLWVGALPKEGRYELIQRLARVLNASPRALAREVDAGRLDPLTPITVKTSVGEEQVHYLYEHKAEFPGVAIVQVYLRDYPYAALAAQVLGYTGEISPEELKRLEGYRGGDRIGKSGIEAAYDSYLRGRAGLAQMRVDSLGRQQSPIELRREAQAGYALRLTLDMRVQRAAEEALQYGIDLAHQNKHWAANGGAIVALDPRDGAVLAMASAPTYKPSLYVGRVDPKTLRALNDESANNPLFNRATAGLYPPGSTWKPVTALAGMEEHVFSPYESLQCTPFATYGLDRQKFRNWNPFVNRPMTLPEALAESCDTYFYEIGNRFYEGGSESRIRMQQWAHRFGFGGPTDLDIGGEADGLLPTPEWRRNTFETDWDRAWNPGDSIQFAIGQKDLLVTPLQMAAFYAMLANGGNIVTPYLVSDVEQPGGQNSPDGKKSPTIVLRRFAPRAPQSSKVDPAALAAVRDGLYLATHSVSGTSSGVFGNYSVPISGKTGTAEKVVPLPGYPSDHLEDQSWWCGWGPSDGARLVVCALIENGGHGSSAAAPAALRVFERYFGVEAPPSVVVDTD